MNRSLYRRFPQVMRDRRVYHTRDTCYWINRVETPISVSAKWAALHHFRPCAYCASNGGKR